MAPDLELKFNDARRRVLNGEALTPAEQAELVRLIRENRFSAAEASTKSRGKKADTAKAAAGISDDDLDADLADLGL